MKEIIQQIQLKEKEIKEFKLYYETNKHLATESYNKHLQLMTDDLGSLQFKLYTLKRDSMIHLLIEKIKSGLNESKANIEEECSDSDNIFNVDEHCGGNYDDCYQLGKEVGEAQFAEELMEIIQFG